jgi:hypothetical protein
MRWDFEGDNSILRRVNATCNVGAALTCVGEMKDAKCLPV